ncbi:hypothetical protein [Aliivibrio fischeri]|uniref:hypothetical protein n=1 Tax=Aliivibrio fischeri TaxID=668 RepID=UPI0012D9EEBB|nr:hypothetical protein [Aliivibrio fischeri]MUJ20414.1 hypothetical protein [Aliivibrio fischeri]
MNFVSNYLSLPLNDQCQVVFTMILLLSAVINFYIEEQNEESKRILCKIASSTNTSIEVVMMKYDEIYLNAPKLSESAKLIKTAQYFSVDISMLNPSVLLA